MLHPFPNQSHPVPPKNVTSKSNMLPPPLHHASEKPHHTTPTNASSKKQVPLVKEPDPVIRFHQSHPNENGTLYRTDLVKDKLFKFSNSVASKLPDRDDRSPQLVSWTMIGLIVRRRPQTQRDLDKIPGLEDLAVACEKTGVDILENIVELLSQET
ncbi:hypothetical protein PtrM4_131690 [Pyrenophora tritici-repentis]|uniref:Uncharacterized protein n=1 Tax=Pyrenophora tritici-repentis TaxID=45151 RepID=A0A316ZMI3_9PLEO|nr:hypothetical protein PtrM4_131690 [Pyrenophora tritici-repentis]